jgi:hypothetical protein
MLIAEVISTLHTYTATVRVNVGGGALLVRTQVHADGMTQARALLLHLYGAGNVLAVA